MKKLSDIVESIIARQSFLEEALHFGFLNLTAFSEYIRPYIEEEAQKEVSVHAIKMMLSRRKTSMITQANLFAPECKKISTRGNLSIMTLVRSEKSLSIVSEYMSEKREKNPYFFTVIEGVHEIDILYATELHEELVRKIPHSLELLSVSGLGLVSLELSEAEIVIPGLFYRVTKQLAFHGINIIQVLSTYHELGIVVAEQDMKRVMSVLL